MIGLVPIIYIYKKVKKRQRETVEKIIEEWIQRAEQEKKTRDEELLQGEEIDNIENKGYKARIMEDSAILGNMLNNLEPRPAAGLQKQIRTAS